MLKYRFCTQLLPEKEDRKIVLLTGARQTGKTTLAKIRYPGLKYINLDAPENRDYIKTVPSMFWGRDVGNAIIDEAQKEPSIFEKIKYAYDEKALNFTIILGSSQILLIKKIRETLSGRIWIYELWPLMMKELLLNEPIAENIPQAPLIDKVFSSEKLCNILGKLPSILSPEEEVLYRDVEDYLLKWGGMPALLELNEEERWKWLKDYEYTYLERDLSDLARLSDLSPFRKFQKLTALRSGGLLSYSEIARDASISVDTARRYLEYLNISYQVILLRPYYKNITSSVIKTPKVYWLDTGLLRQIIGFKDGVTGQIYETMVVSEILKWVRTSQRDCGVYFYRTRS